MLHKLIASPRDPALVNQQRITQANMREAHFALISFAHEFKTIYFKCLPTRVHFVRPCMHSLVHLPRKVVRIGPPICSYLSGLMRLVAVIYEMLQFGYVRHTPLQAAVLSLAQSYLRTASVRYFVFFAVEQALGLVQGQTKKGRRGPLSIKLLLPTK